MWQIYFEAVKRGDWKKALDSLKIILDKEGSDPQVYLKIGDICQRLGKIQDAISSYHQSAWLFLGQGFKQKALAIYKIILRLDPDNEEALKNSRDIILSIESKKERPEEVKNIKESIVPTPPEREPYTFDVSQESETMYPPFLDGIPRDEASRFMKVVEKRFFRKGETVIEEGDSGDSVFFIISGRVKVVTHLIGKTLELATLDKGDIFGEVAFLTGRARTASVVALSDVELIEFTRPVLEEIFERYPSQMRILEDFYQKRLQNTILKAKDKG